MFINGFDFGQLFTYDVELFFSNQTNLSSYDRTVPTYEWYYEYMGLIDQAGECGATCPQIKIFYCIGS